MSVIGSTAASERAGAKRRQQLPRYQ